MYQTGEIENEELNIQWNNLIYNINSIRKQHNLSKKQFAVILNTSEKIIDKIEKQQIPIDLNLQIVFNIHKYFGIEITDLFGKRLE